MQKLMCLHTHLMMMSGHALVQRERHRLVRRLAAQIIRIHVKAPGPLAVGRARQVEGARPLVGRGHLHRAARELGKVPRQRGADARAHLAVVLQQLLAVRLEEARLGLGVRQKPGKVARKTERRAHLVFVARLDARDLGDAQRVNRVRGQRSGRVVAQARGVAAARAENE